jgi:DDE superfamily endonuclease
VAEKLASFTLFLRIFRFCNTSPEDVWELGSRSNTPASFLPFILGSESKTSPYRCSVTRPLFGEFVAAMSGTASHPYFRTPSARADRSAFPPLQRAQIVALACLEPIAKGLHITHWTSHDLARQAVADGIVETICPRTVREILRNVDLQPHRTRYWKTARLDAEFKKRAEKVLWCYGNAGNLAAQGLWVVCVDEIPNFQVLERKPLRRALPGSIERQEFDYIRHGTVNLLMFLVVHSGQMAVNIVEKKDALHYTQALTAFRRRHHGLRGMYLIQDGDPSHTAAQTQAYFHKGHSWWRPRFTPVHASWLNQAELLNGAFEYRYLKRTSWRSREEFIDHVSTAEPEYNRFYAHPFEWTWTNQKMRNWFEEHSA